MWFNNALIYNYNFTELEGLAPQLEDEKLKPCPPHSRFIYGWVSLIGDELTVEPAGSALICLGKEERILPRGVIQKFLEERIHRIETEQGRALKKAERAQLAEDIEFELLPKSFCVQKRLLALLDTQHNKIIINTASVNQANQLLSLLRKSLADAFFEPMATDVNLSLRFAEWIKQPSLLPETLQLGFDCVLFSAQDEKKKVNCKGYELPADEVLLLLEQGLVVAELSLVWRERIQFTLTHDLIFKRIKCLDYLIDEFKELKDSDDELLQLDAEITLLRGEFSALISDLTKLLTISSVKQATRVPEIA